MTSTKKNFNTELSTSYNEFTMSEACFNIGGTQSRGGTELPLKHDIEGLLGEFGDSEETKPLDDLKNMLMPLFKNMFNAINQHSVVINNMKSRQKDFLQEKEVAECFATVQNAMSQYNDEFVEVLEIPDNVKYNENTGRKLTDNTNKMANKVQHLGHACNYLYLRGSADSENYNKFVSTVTTELSNKVSLDRYESEFNKQSESYNSAVTKSCDDMNTKIKDIDEKGSERLHEIVQQIGRLEKDTKWKITECESLLKNRTSKQYVSDCIDNMEDKLMRLIEKYNETSSKTLYDLKNNFGKLEHDLGDGQKAIKLNLQKSIREINELLDDKVSSAKYDEQKRNTVDKCDDCLKKLKDLSRRYDPMIPQVEELKMLHGSFKEVEQQLQDLSTNIGEKIEYLLTKTDELEARPIAVPQQEIIQPHIPNIDENDFEDVKLNVKRMKAEAAQIFENQERVHSNLNQKVDSQIYDKGIGKKIDRDDVYLLLEKFAMEDDRVKKIQSELSTLYKKFDHLHEKTDKKLNRLKKELDLTSIQKLLRSKADDNEVKKEFENFDFKSKSVGDSVNGIKKDLDSMFTSIRKITDVISLLQQEQAQALASTKNLLCLSCGRGDTNFPPVTGQVLGGDGHLYRSDNFSRGFNKVGQKEDPYNYGYEVFDRLEMVREHNLNLHEPTDTFVKSEAVRKNRPASGIQDLKNYKNRLQEEQHNIKSKLENMTPGKESVRNSKQDFPKA